MVRLASLAFGVFFATGSGVGGVGFATVLGDPLTGLSLLS
jgi:hypothetical protein